MEDLNATAPERDGGVRLSHRLAILHLAGIVFLILVVVASLLWVSNEHNRLAKTASERLVAGGVATVLGRAETLVRDYSIWNEAYVAAMTGDVVWLYSNIGNAVTEIGTLDLIVFVDPATGAMLGWRDTSPVEGETDLLPPDMARSLLALLSGPRPTRAVLAELGGEVWALAVAEVQPVGGAPEGVLDTELPRQIHGIRLSQELLDEIGQALLIDRGIEIAAAPGPGQASLPLRDASGGPLGELVWAPPLPGERILSRLALPLSAALGFAAIIALISAWVAVRSALRLEKALDAAKEADRLKTEFLSNVTHELRTPMNGIMGVGQLLRLTELDAEQAELVGVLETSAGAQMALIADLLDFTRLEAGHRGLDIAPFAPARLLGEIGAMIRASAVRRDLAIETDWRALEGLVVAGDARAFRQIVTNLIGNAVKFTIEGGVTARAALQRIGDLAAITVEVSDTGVGIPPDSLERIFERFYRVDGSLTRATDGAGLGLAISARLAALIGGRITVESEVGVGSTFRLNVELPIVESVAEDLRAA